jgi:hypothetical protein
MKKEKGKPKLVVADGGLIGKYFQVWLMEANTGYLTGSCGTTRPSA